MRIRSLLVVVLAAVMIPASGGCGGKRRPRGPTPAEIEAKRAEAKEKELTEDFERIVLFANENPKQIEGIRRRVEEYLPGAKGTAHEESAKRLLQDAEEKFREICNAYFEEKLMPRIRRWEEEEDFEAALNDLKRYNPELLLPEIETKLEEMRARFEREVDAYDDYRPVKTKAEEAIGLGEFDRALATVKAYIENPRFAGTRAAEDMKLMIEKIERMKEEAVALKAEEESGWETLFDGKDDSKWDFGGTEENWKISGGALVAKNESEPYIMAVTGNDEWRDYYVRFRFMLVKGEFFFGCRGGPAPGSDEWSFSRTESPGAGYERGKWYEIRCEVEGSNLKWIRLDNLRGTNYQTSRPTGAIAFRVMEDSEVHFKGIHVKHIGRK